MFFNKNKIKITKEQKKELIDAAVNASKNSYHPITQKAVGAAVMNTEGKIFQGCNIQTTISGLGACAEQCAIYHAVACGSYDFSAVAVSFPSEKFIKPCGMCLQLIAEFAQVADKDTLIIMINSKLKTKETSINKELKDAYGPRVAGKDIKDYEKNHV